MTDKYSLVANDQVQQTQQSFGPNPPAYFPSVQQTNSPVTGVTVVSQPQAGMMPVTTVVTNQPMKRRWMTGMSDCCANCSVCIGVYCCGLCYECAIAKKMEESGCLALCPGGLAGLRTQYRMRHHIEGTMLNDACLSWCCRPCVLCQMANDMNAQGYPNTCCCI